MQGFPTLSLEREPCGCSLTTDVIGVREFKIRAENSPGVCPPLHDPEWDTGAAYS